MLSRNEEVGFSLACKFRIASTLLDRVIRLAYSEQLQVPQPYGIWVVAGLSLFPF